MLLSPLLRKVITALLVLPATSSYADCSTANARDVAVTESGWSVNAVSRHARDAIQDHEADAPLNGSRLSRRAFYGDQATIAIVDVDADL